jgi:hypothetical protein
MKDWDACYRNGDTPWDKGMAAPPLEELLDRHGSAVFRGGPVLVPGCGLGYDVRCLADFGVPAHGVDISETAVGKARAMTSGDGASFEHGDFLDPAWRKDRKFAAIWEHTCFCAIDPALRDAYARAAAGVLEAGGIFAGVFYLTPYAPGEEEEAGPPFKVTVEEIGACFSPCFERIESWAPDRSYPGREGREWIGVFGKLPHPPLVG